MFRWIRQTIENEKRITELEKSLAYLIKEQQQEYEKTHPRVMGGRKG